MITDGNKTIEVRKSRPNLNTPFKCYIYCTQGFGRNTFNVPIPFEKIREHYIETESMECLNSPIGNCKVIGEFTCDCITRYPWVELDGESLYLIPTEEGEASCMECVDAVRYGAGKDLYLWHISDLKIYDTPMELSALGVKRAPQSWCYVKEEKGELMRKTLEHCLQLANNSVVDAELEAIGQGKTMSVADVQKIIVDSLMENGVVVPVRCKDCLYRSQYSDENGLYHCGGIDTTKDHVLPVVSPDFFCAHGERRDDAAM